MSDLNDSEDKKGNENPPTDESNGSKEESGNLNYIFDGGIRKPKADETPLRQAHENNFSGIYGSGFSRYQGSQPSNLYPRSNYVKIFISIFVAIILFASGFLIAYAAVPSEEEKLARWIKSVSDRYFYDADGSGYDFITGIGDGMTGSLDSYSRFYFGENLTALEDENNGIYNDTGMILTIPNGESKLRLLKVYGNSPADKAGLKKGDILYKINETDVSEYTYQATREIITKLKSENKEIKYTFKRMLGSTLSYPTFIHKEEEYSPIFSKYYDSTTKDENDKLYMDGTDLPSDTAVITFEEFAASADVQFAENLRIFKEKGKKKLILDLRTNLGGSLEILQEIASYLISDVNNSQEVEIIKAKFKDNSVVPYNTTSNYYNDYGFEKIVVLADDYSASATEVLICAMKDYNTIDKLVGVNTYGKAVMQSYFEYNGKYGAYITVAELFSPIGNISYNGKGFAPDEAIPFNNAGEFKYDNQLKKAIESVKQTSLSI